SVPAKFLREHPRSCRTPAIQSNWSSRGHSATFPAVTGVDAEADVGMCVKLKELETAMGRFASGFDVSLLSASQAEGVMERAARIEHMAATVKALAAEVCEIAGYGPVPVSVVEDILSRADTFWAAVITRGQGICGVAHLGRHPTVFQRTALEWLYPTCAVEGCNAPVQEWDHRVDWSKSYVTVFDWLDGHCCHHHDKKTLEG